MSRSRATSVLTLALVTAVAALAPAAGASSSPSVQLIIVGPSKTLDLLRARTCQAPGNNKSGARILRKPPSVVACEQPPRTGLNLEGAKSVLASTLVQQG